MTHRKTPHLGLKPIANLSAGTPPIQRAIMNSFHSSRRKRAIGSRTFGALTVILVLTFIQVSILQVRAQEAVSLTGQVVNGTGGAESTSGLTILLLVLDGSRNLISTGQTVTGDDGSFEFRDVPAVSGGSYLLDVEYLGIPYQEIVTADTLQAGLKLTIYETTTQISVIQVERQVMVITGINPQEKEITAIEFVRVSNPGDRTVVSDLSEGTPMGFLRFSLPPGTSDLGVQSDLPSREIISIGTGFAVTSPIAPGDHSIEFSYRFPYQGGMFSYQQNLLQGVKVYQVMAPEESGQLGVRPLAPVETVDIEGTRYKVWERTNISPGDGFELELTNLPLPSLFAQIRSSADETRFWIAGIPVLMGVVLVGLLLLGALNRLTIPMISQGVEDSVDSTSRSEWIRELAHLDQRQQDQGLPEAEYQQHRKRLKDQILGSKSDSEQSV